MMDHVDISEEALANAMKSIMPKMDARTVTLSKLLEHIQRALGAEKEDLKPWKPLIKVLVGEHLHLCVNAVEATPTKSSPVKRTSSSMQAPTTISVPQGTDDCNESDGDIKRKISPKPKAKSKRIFVDDSDEDGDFVGENVHPNVKKDRTSASTACTRNVITKTDVPDEVEGNAESEERDYHGREENDSASVSRPVFKKKARNPVEESSDDDAQCHLTAKKASKPSSKQIYKQSPSPYASSTKRSHYEDENESNDEDEQAINRPIKPSKAKSKKSARSVPSDDESDRENDSDSSPATSPVKKKRGKRAHDAAKSTALTSSGLEALKKLAKIAGVLAPGLYKKLREAQSVDDAEEILRNRLVDANVTWSGRYPTKAEMVAVKKKRDLERELDGIDPSMILESARGTRRSRTTMDFEQVAPVVIESDAESEASFNAANFNQGKSDDEV
ncbi:hypothetical protein, variant 1 [Aphanomyces invadans]|uniref:Histone chaperone domain-containing protein n=1 Tax=Aphanomyces invadans TaxID=157072 RepID=A0A024U744_9STRA|nr:hypothetical protein, variant 1 [Aphanomyces invadans]ETW01717.1 hypothetical protein, variant 1 [Aphanomyces invadans]|eukprot:XP_008869565.1 hypothetical protein, variant 1 [Aphanomyces invadans]